MRTPDLTPEAARELAAIDDTLAGRRVDSELTELGELALALREERPEIDPGFARSLDARKWGSRERRSRLAMPSWFGFAPAFAASMLLALVVSVALLGGGGSDGGDSSGGGSLVGSDSEVSSGSSGSSSSGGGTSAYGTEDSGGDEASAQSESGPLSAARRSASKDATVTEDQVAPGGGGSAPVAPGGGNPSSDSRENRKVERSATLTLAARPRDIDTVSAGVLRVTDALGGFVRSSTVSSSTGGGGGTFELRIPSARLNRALAELSKLGKVREQSQTAEDITGAFVSARDRLSDLQATRRAFLRALGRSTTVNETERIRAELRLIADQIAAAKGAVARVANRASFSTVYVQLVGDRSLGGGGSGDDSWTPGDALRDAGRILEVVAAVALVTLAVLVPVALLALMGWVAGRQVRRLRRERALDAV